MSEDQKVTFVESDTGIRIERLIVDKTRKDSGSDSVYHGYFELSGQPPPEWRSIFGREWDALKVTQAAGIDGAYEHRRHEYEKGIMTKTIKHSGAVWAAAYITAAVVIFLFGSRQEHAKTLG